MKDREGVIVGFETVNLQQTIIMTAHIVISDKNTYKAQFNIIVPLSRRLKSIA